MGAVKEEAVAVAVKSQLELVADVYRDDEDAAVQEGGPWRIGDVSTLDWALARLGALEDEVTQNEDMAATRIQEIERRCARLNERALRGIRFFRSHIEAFATTHRDALLGGGKRKSRALLHGTVGWRRKPATLEVVDKEALLAWAQGQPVELGLVRMREEPCLSEVKAYAERARLVPPGTQAAPEHDELQIRVDTKGVAS